MSVMVVLLLKIRIKPPANGASRLAADNRRRRRRRRPIVGAEDRSLSLQNALIAHGLL